MDYSLTYFLDLVFAFLLGAWVTDKIIFYKIRKALEEAGKIIFVGDWVKGWKDMVVQMPGGNSTVVDAETE